MASAYVANMGTLSRFHTVIISACVGKSEYYGKAVEYEDSCECYEEMENDEEYEVDFDALHNSVNIKGFGQGN